MPSVVVLGLPEGGRHTKKGIRQMANSPVIHYVHRREFVLMLMDLWGVSQQEADSMVDGTLGGISAWLLDVVRNVPEGCEARLLVSGFGSFRVNVQRRGRRNPEKLRAGLVGLPPLTVRVDFVPCEQVRKAIRRANSELKRPTASEIAQGRFEPPRAVRA